MEKIYISYTNTTKDKVIYISGLLSEKGYEVIVNPDDQRGFTSSNQLIVFIDNNQDLLNVKSDINVWLNTKKPVIIVLVDNPQLEQGIKLQIGLCDKVSYSDNTGYELLDLLSENTKKQFHKKKTRLIISIGSILLLIALFIGFYCINKSSYEEIPKISENSSGLIINDNLFKALLLNGADKDNDGNITREEMEELTILDLSGKDISDITELVYCINLTELDLSNNYISDITPVAALKNLKKINLTNNEIDNYQVLEYIDDLEIIK